MTLVDTSVWIDHFRKADRDLQDRLHDGTVVCHPFVIGEIAVGSIRQRAQVIELLEALPALEVAAHERALRFIERHDLSSTGLGWVDVHLLAAAAHARVRLWTHDRRLRTQVAKLNLS